jgi:hypothetical protein
LGIGEKLHSSPDGTLWLITDRGVAKLENGSWNVYLSNYKGQVAGIDAAGRVWVVSEDTSQISAWDGISWTVYGAKEGWTPIASAWYDYVSGGQSDALGRIWFGTAQDVRVFDGASWIVIRPEDMGMGLPVYDDLGEEFNVSILSSGAVWVLECDWGGPGPIGGRGARWFDGSTWHGADSPVASGCATAIAEDDTGHVWLGVEEILWRYDPASDTWAEFTPPEPPTEWGRFGWINHVALDPAGDPWVGIVICGGASCYGNIALYHIHDGTWIQVGAPSDFGGLAWGPFFDVRGTLWLFWDDGIFRVVGDTLEPMASHYSPSAIVDGSGQVWFLFWHGEPGLWTIDVGGTN